MSEIRIKENESIDSALRRFKRSCAKAGTLSELRKREHYESPSVKRRKKSEAARAKKNSAKQRFPEEQMVNVCSFFLHHRLIGDLNRAGGSPCPGSSFPAPARQTCELRQRVRP